MDHQAYEESYKDNFISNKDFKYVYFLVVVVIYLSARTQKIHEQITVVIILLF